MGKIAMSIMLICSVMTSSCALFFDKPERTAEYFFERQDYREAFSRLWWPANLGKPRAQYALGYMYFYGLNTPVDHDMARVWFSHAAVQGYEPAKVAMKMLTNPEFTQFDQLTKLKNLHPLRYTYDQFTPLDNQDWVRLQSGGNYTVCILRAPEIDIIENCLARGKIPDRVVKYRYREAGKFYIASVAGNFPSQREADLAADRLNRTLHITTAQPILWRNVHHVMLPL